MCESKRHGKITHESVQESPNAGGQGSLPYRPSSYTDNAASRRTLTKAHPCLKTSRYHSNGKGGGGQGVGGVSFPCAFSLTLTLSLDQQTQKQNASPPPSPSTGPVVQWTPPAGTRRTRLQVQDTNSLPGGSYMNQ